MVKTFLLDTNILMTTEGKVLLGFDDNEVIITHTTLEELDHLKTLPGETGYQARESIRIINQISEGKMADEDVQSGIKLENGGTFKLEADNISAALPSGWSMERADNRIFRTAKSLSDSESRMVILITNDVSMRIKAEAIGLSGVYKNL